MALADLAQQIRIRRREEPADDRLLRLFWNRAELKREFAKLQRERDRMVAHLRQQEGSFLRVQQRLEQLEGLLGDPQRAANVAVYYQLRGVSHYARRRLQRLARDLKARQQELEGQREAARFEEHRQAALRAMEQRLESLRERQAAVAGELEALRARLDSLRGFWNAFRRRSLGAEIASLEQSAESLSLQQERYLRAIEEKSREKAGEPDAMGVEGKRLVNLSLIALAQELVLNLLDHDVASLAREASVRPATEVAYGSASACRELSGKIDGVLRRLDEMDDLPVRMRRRAEYLRRLVEYRRDSDTVPVAASCDSIPWVLDDQCQPVQGAAVLTVNVLADDYWEIYSVLLN